MTAPVLILVATMSGTAEMVAEEVAARIEDAGVSARIVRMERASPELLSASPLVIICTSTYGTGDVPDNGQKLYGDLQRDRPDLSGVRYGVVGLGDSIYPQTFCFGGRKFDELLAELGATRVCDRLQHDRRSGIYPEDAAGAWTETWLQAATAG